MASGMLAKLKNEAKRVNDVAESRGGDFGPSLFKPEKGPNLIRILPHWNKKKRQSDELFFVRRLVHYLPVNKTDGTGTYNAPIRCLKDDQDETCPACVAYGRLKKAQSKKTSDLRPTERYLYNIIDYGTAEREPQVMVYSAPFTIHKEVMNWVEELGTEFWSVESGRDWKLIKSVDAKKGARNGTSYKMMPKLQDTAIPKKLIPLLDNMVDLEKMWGEYDEKGMAKSLKAGGFLVKDEDSEEEVDEEVDDEDEEETPKPKSKPKAKPKDEDDDEEEEDEDEDEEESKSKKSAKPKAKPKAEDDEEEEEEEDEDEEETPKSKKSAKSKAKPEAEDDEEEEEDEDEEEAPKSKVKKSSRRGDDVEDELRKLGV